MASSLVLLAAAFLGLGAVNCDKDSAEYHRYRPDKVIDYFVKCPVTKFERQCFEEKLRPGDSIDIVIDLAPSPSHDKVDKMCANSPIGLYLEQPKLYHSPTRSYFDMVALFIDIVTFGMKPESTHVVIYENGSKFYIRGRAINETVDVQRWFGGDFSDAQRNLKTMWPSSTKSGPETHMAKILVNNLGRMTKLALWNRDNGLPTVLASSRRSKPVFTIVLTDGASGASINDLTDDLSRTTVLDLGNNRFVDRLQWEQVRLMPNVFTVAAPQSLLAFTNSVRNMACLLASHHSISS